MRTRGMMRSRRRRGLHQPARGPTWMRMPPTAWRQRPATPRRASTRRCPIAEPQLLCILPTQHAGTQFPPKRFC
jgi:hypothetical protein